MGRAAVPPLTRVGLATVVLFAICGYGPTRLLLPSGLRRHEPLWVLPVGACVAALALALLGYAHVPFRVALGVVLAAGVALALVARRRRPPAPPGAWRSAGWPAYIAVLLAAVALVPLFRAGFATVEGQGQDAHLAVGTAQFLQSHPPDAIAPEMPVDRVPLVWRSKPPIYYALGASATLAGKEVYETISAFAAVLLGLAALGFFLLARELLRAPPWVALSAMALVGLDRIVLHTVMHPYFNQTWGFMTLPFAVVLTWWAVRERTRGGLVLLGLFLAVGAFAYPLMLPIPGVVLAFLLWPERRRLDPRRLYHGRRSLLWMVPLFAVLVVPIRGVLEKVASADNVVFGGSLRAWGGDLTGFFGEERFFGMPNVVALVAFAPFLLAGLWHTLRELAPPLRRALLALLLFTLVFAVEFRLRDFGWYFHFKVLAFVAPLALALAVVGLVALAGRVRPWLAYATVAVLVMLSAEAATKELSETFDQLPRQTLELRTLEADVPPGDSIRLDIRPTEQNWVAYMLHRRPLCSQRPLDDTSYPHVPRSRRADFILTERGKPVPRDATGPPVRQLEAFTLWEARAGLPGPERCSRRMVQTVKEITDAR